MKKERMAKGKANPAQPDTRWFARMMLQGWVSIAVWMSFGLLLEGLLGYKIPAYLGDPERRELFRLAHTHGTLLGLVLVAAALSSQRLRVGPTRAARIALRAGSIVMPIGFLLAGVYHPEGDPGLAIWLVPPSALLVIFGAVSLAMALAAKPAAED
jgi:hypothetical protein